MWQIQQRKKCVEMRDRPAHKISLWCQCRNSRKQPVKTKLRHAWPYYGQAQNCGVVLTLPSPVGAPEKFIFIRLARLPANAPASVGLNAGGTCNCPRSEPSGQGQDVLRGCQKAAAGTGLRFYAASSFHLMEQPMLGTWFSGPLPVSATCFMASNRSRLAPSTASLRLSSSRPRYCSCKSAL